LGSLCGRVSLHIGGTPHVGLPVGTQQPVASDAWSRLQWLPVLGLSRFASSPAERGGIELSPGADTAPRCTWSNQVDAGFRHFLAQVVVFPNVSFAIEAR